jgi:hypothetical protein
MNLYFVPAHAVRSIDAKAQVGSHDHRMARSIVHDLSVLCRPLVLGEVQNAFNIKPGGRFVTAVKNPEATSPTGIGLEVDQQADFTAELSVTFITQAPRCFETSAGQPLVRSGRHSGCPG